MKHIKSQNGYTLVEVVISIVVAIMVIGALTFATISSLRNAQLAKKQSQATKYAQEGLERVRGIRDRNGAITNFGTGNPVIVNFSDLWNVYMSRDYCSVLNVGPGPCYFKFPNSNGDSLQSAANSNDMETINNTNGIGTFQRQIQFIDQDCTGNSNCYQTEKEIISIVKWSDFAGDHQSKLTTILRKI